MPFEIPEVVANKARVAGAGWWLDELADRVAELAARWDLTVGRPFADGTEAWVAPVEREAGGAAVLKVCVPRPGDAARLEAAVLRLAGGQGCAELLDWDEEREALLVERLGPSLHDLGRPADERHRILAAVAAELWQPAAALPTEDRALLVDGRTKAGWLIEQIVVGWEELGRPCSRAAVDHAVVCAERRAAAHDDARAWLVHGDVHEWNTLQAPGTPAGWKLIDPDGLVAEREYDLGVILREDPVELAADLADGDPRRRARRLARWTGADENAAWEWGVVERVSTGLLATRIGLQPVDRDMLALADRLAERA